MKECNFCGDCGDCLDCNDYRCYCVIQQEEKELEEKRLDDADRARDMNKA
jgi:hypothetical protein